MDDTLLGLGAPSQILGHIWDGVLDPVLVCMLLGLGTHSQISGHIWDGVPKHGMDYTLLGL
jgi:hypothetical protein